MFLDQFSYLVHSLLLSPLHLYSPLDEDVGWNNVNPPHVVQFSTFLHIDSDHQKVVVLLADIIDLGIVILTDVTKHPVESNHDKFVVVFLDQFIQIAGTLAT